MIERWCCGALAATLAVAGCGNDSKDASKQKATPVREASAGERGPTAPGAAVAFTAPKAGSSTGATVTARVKLTKFELEPDAVGDEPQPGHGHLHFALDSGRYDRPPWSPGATSPLASKLHATGKFTPATSRMVVYRRVPKGEHRLVVYLANNDGTNTDISATTIFKVK